MSMFERSPSPWTDRMLSILRIVAGLVFFITGPIAFVLAGEMAVAYFQGSFPLSFWPTANWGVSAILYCFIFLYFMLAGAGPWSVDALIAGRRVRRIDCRNRPRRYSDRAAGHRRRQ